MQYNGESKARTMRTENFHEILKEMQQIPVLYPDGLTSLNILRRTRGNRYIRKKYFDIFKICY